MEEINRLLVSQREGERVNNIEILHHAFKRALQNGWKHESVKECLTHSTGGWHPENLIFSHDFAKAFWPHPSRADKWYMSEVYPEELWQYHLQRMVLEENPIKYLEQFLSPKGKGKESWVNWVETLIESKMISHSDIPTFRFRPLEEIREMLLETGYSEEDVEGTINGLAELPEYASQSKSNSTSQR